MNLSDFLLYSPNFKATWQTLPRGLTPSGGQSPLCSSKPAAIPPLPVLLQNKAVRSQPLLIYKADFWWHLCISESPEETT